LSGTGNTYDRLEYSGPDTVFKNTSLEEEQALKAQVSLDFSNDNKLVVGGVVKRADFNIDIWNIPDTLRTYTGPGDLVGSVVTDPATGKSDYLATNRLGPGRCLQIRRLCVIDPAATGSR